MNQPQTLEIDFAYSLNQARNVAEEKGWKARWTFIDSVHMIKGIDKNYKGRLILKTSPEILAEAQNRGLIHDQKN